jgi:hypothetical protein
MADVLTRFKLETTQYDSKLRDASKGIAEYTRQATLAGNEFSKFTQKNVEAARALGSLTPSATNAKDKVKELVGAFNDAARAYNSLTKEQQQSDFGKAMAESIKQLNDQLKVAKQELYGVGDAVNKAGGGGLFSGMGDKMSGALQVFAGNMMTKAAGAVASLGSEMVGMVQQGVELAKQGEGIRVAFERLGRGDILNGLREATHGTVTDLELMKAAVKFNDFKLPLDELGTMLAFAQQKAKDTGQSVDYMVDSIVTGLGRKSLMILDNLGLSATEVKEKMKETGDMTKAVGEIIREQMSKAGDYVETAADRATQANVNLQNKMEELGRKFAPVEEASSQLWTSMKISILDIIGGPLATLLNQLTEAGRLKNMLNSMNGESGSGNTKVDQQLKKLKVIKKGGGSDYIFNSTLNGMMEGYNRQIMALDAQIKNGGKPVGGGSGSSQDIRYLQRQMEALKIMRDQLQSGAKDILNPAAVISSVVGGSGSGRGGKGGSVTDPSANIQSAFEKAMSKAIISADSLKGADSAFEHMSVWGQMTDDFKRNMLGVGDTVDELEKSLIKLGEITDKDDITSKLQQMNKALSEQQTRYNLAGQAAQNFGAALAGVEDPAAKAAGTVMQAVASIALGFAMASSNANTAGTGWGWLAWLAAGTAAMATTIATVHSLTGYAQGGMIKGNSYSGDNIGGLVDGSQLVGLNAGELVLNAAQQNNVAQNLEGAGARTVRVVGKIHGTDIILSADRTLMEQGKQLAVWGRG